VKIIQLEFFMKFKNLKLGKKQILGFGAILIIMAAANMFSIRNMRSIKNEIDEVTSNWLPRGIAISDINKNTTSLRLNQLQHAMATDEESKQLLSEVMIGLIDKINENLDTYEKLKTESESRNLYSDEERRLFNEFDSKWERYQELSFTFFALSRDNKRKDAVDLMNGEARQVFNDFGNDLEELVKVNQEDARKAALRAEEKFYSARAITLTLLIISTILSIVIAWILVRYITNPVYELESAAEKVAEGNLNVLLPVKSSDEIGHLAGSFNQMTEALRLAREKTEKQAEMLRSTNSELGQKNQDLQSTMEELRETQEQLVLNEKLAGLGQLVAGISHEINNPIGTVISSMDVLKRCLVKIRETLDSTMKEGLSETLNISEDNIKVSVDAGNRIALITKSLKNFAALDESDYQVVNIHQGIDNSLTLLESELRDRIKVTKHYGDIPKIGCYPGQLNQVFMNLFKNASQAIADSGSIEVKTSQENNHIKIEIADTGRGIPSEKLNRIFDFGFTPGEARVKMSSGLTTAYNIILKHKGRIKVESREGRGTTVSIFLPIR
jgi:two-component system NtrC family sensor kinase